MNSNIKYKKLIQRYTILSRFIGGLTNWNQGPGGNISIKYNKDIIIKKSGSLLSNTTCESNFVICDINKVLEIYKNNDDNSRIPVTYGDGKPSIELFMHLLPSNMIVHLHPSPILSLLCSNNDISIKNIKTKTIGYYKPGIKLANELFKVYENDINIYFLRNHGIIILGNTEYDIINYMNIISNELFNTINNEIKILYHIYNKLYESFNYNYIIKQVYNICIKDTCFKPYTPDMALFLQNKALILDDDTIENYINIYNINPTILVLENNIYIIGTTLEQCNSIYEILHAYNCINNGNILNDEDINEITNWDKEIERKNAK